MTFFLVSATHFLCLAPRHPPPRKMPMQRLPLHQKGYEEVQLRRRPRLRLGRRSLAGEKDDESPWDACE